MIEYRYFKALNTHNQKKVVDLLNYQLKNLLDSDVVDSDDYFYLEDDFHHMICELLREQSTVNNKL